MFSWGFRILRGFFQLYPHDASRISKPRNIFVKWEQDLWHWGHLFLTQFDLNLVNLKHGIKKFLSLWIIIHYNTASQLSMPVAPFAYLWLSMHFSSAFSMMYGRVLIFWKEREIRKRDIAGKEMESREKGFGGGVGWIMSTSRMFYNIIIQG